jgi:hypothetical protein
MNMDTKNGVLLMPLVSPRRSAKQPSSGSKCLLVCTLAGLAAGFSLGLCCGFFGSPNGTARTAHYLSAPLPQHAVIEEFVYVSQPSYSAPVAALSSNGEAAVAAVPAAVPSSSLPDEAAQAAATAVEAAAANATPPTAPAAAAAEPIFVGPGLPELPALEMFITPSAGYSHYHGKYFSQSGQDDLIDELLGMQEGGFFIE